MTLHTPIRAEAYDLSATVIIGGEPARATGRLAGPDGAPVFAVLGGISADRHVGASGDAAGWWRAQYGLGRPLDPSRIRILSIDFLDTIRPWPSTRDQARALFALARAAGIERLSLIGASYGGMVALSAAALAPERVERVLCISAADRASASARAWRSIQREIVELARTLGDAPAGLDLARRLAMTTYRTGAELEARFLDPDPDSRDAAGVEAYLAARGADYAARTRPERFLALSRSLDEHLVDVADIHCPVDYLAVREDRLVPVDQIAAAAGRTPQGRLDVIGSLYGHDAFLKEVDAVADRLAGFVGAPA